MSSTIHSAASTSSDAVFCPHPLNHVNHNHADASPTKSKSLKRSLTQDSANELDVDTPTKKSRKRRSAAAIDHSLGTSVSADKLHVYRWPTNESHADLHVLQEQICDYLSLKSFKRKYPDIHRRMVDLHEREYLRSQNVVSETQCDLGLTALKLDDVLKLMSDDYPEKCHQFNHAWQQKRRALAATNNTIPNNHSTTPTVLSATVSNPLSAQATNLPDNADKTRPSKSASMLRRDLLRSTMDFNAQLQRDRLEDRKACFDLQTMQIHYPSNRQFRLPSHLTRIGSYPLALVPGQFHDSYIKYTADELKYMPLNTALYYYPKPLSLVRAERFTQQGAASSDDEEERCSTSRVSHSHTPPAQIRPATPQSPLAVNGARSTKPATPTSTSNHTNLCHMCKTKGDEIDEEFMTCTSCQHQFHPICLDVNAEMSAIIKTYPWQCMDCKSCGKCSTTHDEANMMFCDRCDRGYHSYCVGLQAIPDGSWQCSACDPPAPSPPLSSPSTPISKGKRGRPPNSSRSSPRPPPPPTTPLKSEPVPTRVSSRRRQPVSPSSNTNQSSNSSSVDVQSSSMPNSPSVSLVLTRHQQQWTTTPIHPQTITSANPR